ncbi:serine/threonine-protein kinase [Paludisphaera soli]|uniref:serine/threonine-protein kinase n=1 Tax=Paludisphaera soli TaxID=2712865 RepID=UPI0013EAAFAA|nr:serine/threonine-protein kinase [Paludisphaera soli]
MAAADRDLLYGLLALQVGLIDQGQLVASFQAWTRDKSRGLADHLGDRGALDAEQRALLEGLAAQHLRRHGGDAEESLASLAVGASTREALRRLADPEVDATIDHLGSDSTAAGGVDDRTASFSVGTATSDGQRFRVLRPHAQGGLGAVFVAFDGELRREVALKRILDRHADDAASRQRFLLEAEITGGLEHPGIVPVYGLGAYGDGRPYYAMRFIRGDSLKEAIAAFHGSETLKRDAGARSLALRKLLRRFIDVCNAIDYAHTRGVLHRDVKPGNVIVGKHGETLVVDWGLAKALGRREAGEGLADDERTLTPSSSGSSETLPGSALGTPAYMSPEQAAGDLDRLGPRSDVYSLGATLYCLLTGEPPFRHADVVETLQAVRRGEFAPPRALVPTIDPALEAVCLKAMATRPEDRYDACRALADDVERWAADEPVRAWAEPLARRARRWARRNRTAVTAAVVALAAGVVGLAAVLAVQVRSKAALEQSLGRETRANAALARSQEAVQARYDLAVEAIRTFHTGVAEDFLLREDEFKDLRDRLLKSASDFYGKLGAMLDGESDPASRRALAEAHFETAQMTAKVGRTAAALETHRRVLAEREALAAPPGGGGRDLVDVGRSLTAVAALLHDTGRADEALATFIKAESALAPPADDAAMGARLAALGDCRRGMGRLLLEKEGPAAALAKLQEARVDLDAARDAGARDETVRRARVATAGLTAVALNSLGRTAECEAERRRELALAREFADEDPASAERRSNLAIAHGGLGRLMAMTGRSGEAEAEFRAGLAISRELADANPGVALLRERRAAAHEALGELLGATGRAESAEAEFRAALAIARELADDDPGVTARHEDVARVLRALGGFLQAAGKPAEAEAAYREGVELARKSADGSPDLPILREREAIQRAVLGNHLQAVGKSAEAEPELRAALATFARVAGDRRDVPAARQNLSSAHADLARLLAVTGRAAEAEAEYLESLRLSKQLIEEEPTVSNHRVNLARTLLTLGSLRRSGGRAEEAAADFRAVVAIDAKLVEAEPAVLQYRRDLGAARSELGFVLWAMGKLAEAEAEMRAGVEDWLKLADDAPGPEQLNGLAGAHGNLGMLLGAIGREADSKAELLAAIETYEELVRINPAVTESRINLAECHNALGGTELRADAAAAEAEFRAACEVLEKLAEENPSDVEARIRLATARTNLGMTMAHSGRFADAEAELRGAAEAFRKKLAAEPADLECRVFLANALASLGRVLDEAGNLNEAVAQLREATTLAQEASEEQPGDLRASKFLVPARGDLGTRLLLQGRKAEAEAELRTARAIALEVVEASPEDEDARGRSATARVGLGRLLLGAGDAAGAEAEFRAASDVLEPLAAAAPPLSDHHSARAEALVEMAEADRLLGRAAQAGEALDRVVEFHERYVAADPVRPERRFALARALRRRGLARRDLGDLAGAGADARRAAEGFDGLPPRSASKCFEAAAAHAALAGLAGEEGSTVPAADAGPEADRAVELLRRALALGFRDADALRTEAALDAVRGRNDFRAIAAGGG